MARKKNPMGIPWWVLIGGGVVAYMVLKKKNGVLDITQRPEAARGMLQKLTEAPARGLDVAATALQDRTALEGYGGSLMSERGYGSLGAHTLSSRGRGSLGA